MPVPQVASSAWIDERARAFIEKTALASPHLETGGALFGWSSEVGVVIACAYGPGPAARRRRFTLVADRSHTEELINTVHSASDGRYRFLGSWHSHPGGTPQPSRRDHQTAVAMASDPPVRLPQPTILVIGLRRRHWFSRSVSCPNLKAYVWDPRSDFLLEATLVNTRLLDRFCSP